MRTFVCRHLHRPAGWLTPGVLRVDEHGIIEEVGSTPVVAAADDSIVELDGWVVGDLPGTYLGTLTKDGQTVSSCTCATADTRIKRPRDE